MYGTISYHPRPARAAFFQRSLPIVLVVLAVAGLAVLTSYRLAHRPIPAGRAFDGAGLWPRTGQAAFSVTGGPAAAASPDQRPVPIASVAKVMTAYLVLKKLPLKEGESGPDVPVTDDDVADTDVRRRQGESVVEVSADAPLTELQGLQALLIPSGNNVAMLLARFVAGSEDAFVAEMNAQARTLAMHHTHYTDPSGLDAGTVSTASDQLILLRAALKNPVLAAIAGTASVRLPTAGVVHNTDTLLGKYGVVAGKTGSDDAAGGCFAFRAVRTVAGRQVTITAVILGQRDGPPIEAVLAAARGLLDRVMLRYPIAS